MFKTLLNYIFGSSFLLYMNNKFEQTVQTLWAGEHKWGFAYILKSNLKSCAALLHED